MASDIVPQLVLGVASAAISGVAVWSAQRLRTAGRTQARRRFLGLPGRAGGACRIVVGHHHASEYNVHRYDVAAMLEVAGLVQAAGASTEVLSAAEARSADTGSTEFVISGPDANERTAAHLRRHLPGLTWQPYRKDDPERLMITAGEHRFKLEHGKAEFVVLARIHRPGLPPRFIIAGQTGITNRAGAVFLVRNLPLLRRRFSDDRSFCLMLHVVEPAVYAYHEVEEAADITAEVLADR